jgi:hypothetical protein
MRVATSSGVRGHRLIQIHAPSVGPPSIRLRSIRHRPDSPTRRRLIQIHASRVEPPLIQLRQIHRRHDSPTHRCLIQIHAPCVRPPPIQLRPIRDQPDSRQIHTSSPSRCALRASTSAWPSSNVALFKSPLLRLPQATHSRMPLPFCRVAPSAPLLVRRAA